MARQPAQVVGIVLRQLLDALARVVTEVDTACIERRVGGTLVTRTDRKAAFAVDLEAPMLALKNAHLPAPALPRLPHGAGTLGPPMPARHGKFRFRRRVLPSRRRA